MIDRHLNNLSEGDQKYLATLLKNGRVAVALRLLADRLDKREENNNKHRVPAHPVSTVHCTIEVRPMERRPESPRDVDRNGRPLC